MSPILAQQIIDLSMPEHATPEAFARWVWRVFLIHGVPLLIILIVSVVVVRGVTLLGSRIVEHAKKQSGGDADEAVRRAQTLSAIFGYTAKIFVFGIAILAILREFGTDVTPLLTGAGIMGVVIGLGAQSLVKDILTGVFIFTENQYSIGDVVELGGKTGTVEAINLRTTILRSSDGAVHIIPNGTITVATNMSYRWSRAVIDLQIGYDADFDKVISLLKKVAAEAKADPALSKDLLEEPGVFGPEAFNEHSLKVTMSVKVHPLRQWEVGRALRRRIRTAFDREGILIPVPQRMIQVKSGDLVRPPAAPVP